LRRSRFSKSRLFGLTGAGERLAKNGAKKAPNTRKTRD
jgi:hypothetical protein